MLKRFFKHFHDLLIYILLGAALITAALAHWVDTGVILAVVLVNAIIGFIQEGKAEQALEGIRKMLSLHAHTRREGEWIETDAEELVPGDVVRLRSGDRLPADVRLTDAVNLRIEESALTGESAPTEKRTDPAAADAGVGDRHCMAYSGTMVAAGRGIGVVTATGAATELGRINRMIEELSNRGLRVLAAAARDADVGKGDLTVEDLEGDMVFLGLVGIFDPPRPEAIEAIKICRQAGIRVKMITGDHAGTAKSIGREMGISDGEHAVTGPELEAASDEELRRLVHDNDIFARTSPEHKLRLVQALQANGEVVAMTGDGVNDAPALKRADVGVAMGIKGTEATKEAADIVLADDNFTTIERAVEAGRTIHDNLRKAILFILPTNGAEGLVILSAVLFGFVLPLTPVQILWVNMITAVTLALAMAFEPSEPGVMRRPPRDPRAAILGAAFLWRIAFVSVLIGGATIAVFLVEIRIGMPVELARTVAVNTLVCSQAFYLFNSRYLEESSLTIARLFSNRIAWLAVGVLALLQLMFVYAPFMQHWFQSASLELRHWLAPMAIGFAVFLIVEAEKAAVRRYFPNR